MKKITYLDGLRGLAAFVVVIHHFILAFYPALFFGPYATAHLPGKIELFASGTMLNLFYNGNFAVCIFFILSGFVLSWKFFATKEKNLEMLVSSGVKRYFRLAFPVAFSAIVAFLLMKYGFFYNKQVGNAVDSGWIASFWTLVPNFKEALSQSFYGTFFSNEYDYNTVLWTISYEFFGAFLIYGFLALVGKSKYRVLFYAALMIIFWQTYYLAFILGMLLSDLMASQKIILSKIDKTKILRVIILFFGLFLGSFPSGRDVVGTMYAPLHFVNWDILPMLYHIAGAFLVMLVILDSARIQNFFSNKIFIFLGKISFSMYLLHLIIIGSLSSFMFVKLIPLFSYHLAFFFTFGISIPIIIAVSYAVYITVEKGTMDVTGFAYEKIAEKIKKLGGNYFNKDLASDKVRIK